MSLSPLVLSAACLSASPSLAALHATRARLAAAHDDDRDPSLDTHCTKCGTYLLDGHGGSIVLTRRVNNTFVQRTCHACGYRQLILCDRGNAVLFPKRRRRLVRHAQSFIPDYPPPSETTTATTTCDYLLSLSPQSPQQQDVTASQMDTAKSTVHPTHNNDTPAPPKTRRNKKTALQLMLLRNRERELSDRKASQDQDSSGLAAFLGGL